MGNVISVALFNILAHLISSNSTREELLFHFSLFCFGQLLFNSPGNFLLFHSDSAFYEFHSPISLLLPFCTLNSSYSSPLSPAGLPKGLHLHCSLCLSYSPPSSSSLLCLIPTPVSVLPVMS